jgi:hypothetical protein
MAVGIAIVAAAIIGGKMSSDAQAQAARSASRATTTAAEEGIAEERRQFDILTERYDREYADQVSRYEDIQKMLAPYVKAGQTALTSKLAMSGLAGKEAQAAEIAGIEESPIFQALTEQGEKAILSKESATGGLRGGNIQAALAQFRPAMLKNELESKYAKISELASTGLPAITGAGAGPVGTGGPQPTGNIASLLQSMGSAKAQEALIGGQAQASMYGDISSSAMLAAMMKGKGGF